MQALGEYIKRQLEARDQLQTSLAEALNTSRTNVSRWIAGQTPDFDSCLAIAHYFGESPEKIMRLAGKEELLKRYLVMKEREAQTDLMPPKPVNAEDREAHRQLQAVLDAGEPHRGLILLGVASIWEHVVARKKRRHGRFAPPE